MKQGTEVDKRYYPKVVAHYFSHDEEKMMDKLRQLAAVERMCAYELGVRLHRVMVQGLWQKHEYCTVQESYPTYGAWVSSELGFSDRKGRYLAWIARNIDEMNIPAKMIVCLMRLGWSKAYHLLHAEDLPQLMEWYTECKSFGERAISTYVRLQSGLDEDSDELEDPIKLSMNFKRKSQYEFFRKALAAVEHKHGVTSGPEAVSIMAANFLATTLPGGIESQLVELDLRIQAIEVQYGVKIAVVHPSEKEDVGEEPTR